MTTSSLSGLFWSILVFTICTKVLSSSCPNLCSGHGECDKYGRCECTKQFSGADCSLRVCPKGAAWNDIATATDTAHGLATCSNRGLCDTTSGTCTCAEGFVGAACERLDCFAGCNTNGNCMTMSNLALYTRDQWSNKYDYTSVWDAHKIKGCVCDPQFRGYDCSLRVCPDGDDPLTTAQRNTVQLVRCIANTGNFVLFFKGLPSRTIPWTANPEQVRAALLGIPYITNVKVTFSQIAGTVCQTDTNVVQVEFLEQFGPLPPMVPQMDAAMAVSGRITISADGVQQFSDVSGTNFVSVVGTKEADKCANRGICSVADGTCLCFATNGDTYGSSNGYGLAGTRGDCGFITSGATVATCPGGIQCSGHGVCVKPQHRCSCSVGWEAGDCSERTCPTGLSWFAYPNANNIAHRTYTTCSSMGLCDTSTGTCVCRTGFYGSSCQYMGCGGGLTTPCNGHGKCLNMQELAQNAKVNGEAIAITYGVDPNNAKTWDGSRIYGCMCDEGYDGYDCSERTCPLGDDPHTYDDHNEVQLLKCIASGGTFKLTFRDAQTPALSYNITSGQLMKALSALPTVQKVTVTYTLDGTPPPNTLATTQPPRAHTEEGMDYALLKKQQHEAYNESNPLRYVPVVPHGNVNGTSEREPDPIYWNLDDGFSLCNTSGTNVAIIAFDVMTGDVPPIRVDKSLLTDIVNNNGVAGTGQLTIYSDGATIDSITSVRGTTEVAVCNNRGVCNKVTGVCECFDDWTSSNGHGGPGNLGDCAYLMDKSGVIRGQFGAG